MGNFLSEALSHYIGNNDVKNFEQVMEISEADNRTIIIEGIDETSGTVADQLIRFWNKVDELNKTPIEERKPIKIYINSPGGSLVSTLTIIDAIKLSKTPVWTINIGMAYSGGFFIFINGHKRITYPNSSFLYHEGSTGVDGDASKFQDYADFYKRQRVVLKKIVLENTKITPEQYKDHIKDDWWLLSDEALELGVCDEISSELI